MDPSRVGLIDSVPDAVIVVGEDACLHYANPAAEALFGWRAEDHLGRDCFELIHPDDLEFALLSSQTVMRKEVGSPIEIRVLTATGWRLVELIGRGISTVDLPSGIVLSLRDLTERRRWEVAGDDLALFRTLVQNAAGITMLVDPDGTVRAVSAAITRILGHDPADVQGRDLAQLVVAADRGRFRGALTEVRSHREGLEARRVSIDLAFETRDGEGSVPLQLTIVDLLDDPTVAGLVVSGQDISELQAARRRLAHAAEHDELTGLPNRAHLTAQLRARLGDDGPRSTAVAFLDLDRFKIMNDLFGHDVGDEILVTVARRLENTVRAGDLVARFGGDEFVVIASAISDAETRHLESRLEAAVAEPMRLRTGPLQVYCSIGLVVAHPGDVMEDVLADADAAMYDVKNRSRGVIGARTRPLGERRALAEDLDNAFRHGQFTVHYQPIVELHSVRTIGLEALVRWHHPRRGLLMPSDFIDVVEDTRRDGELGDLVLSTALADMREFRRAADDDLWIAVNVTLTQLAEPGLAERMEKLVTSADLSTATVVLEISERALVDSDDRVDMEPARLALETLSATGFRIAVDDFGTGYSSLNHLVAFPVDVLKIDRSFVAGIGQDKSRESIVSALVALAGDAGMDVVAKGIEQESQVSALARLDCTLGQGFYFDRPMTRGDTLAQLRTGHPGPVLTPQTA